MTRIPSSNILTFLAVTSWAPVIVMYQRAHRPDLRAISTTGHREESKTHEWLAGRRKAHDPRLNL